MTSRLQRALEDLYGLERRKDKLGLEGTRALLGALGNPQRRFRAVHVAGTNGKGTVCALVERVLREAGYRTGLFTSPHLVDFRERIRVNGRWADEEWLEQALVRIQALPEGRDRTFFEVATALGFLYFAEQDVEWAVVEVGLGGRLDTTNVIEPDVTVITSIGFDHGEILGDTLEKIAAEKAGILKPGVPLVSGVASGPAERVIARMAEEIGVPWGKDEPEMGEPVEPPPTEVQPGLLNRDLARAVLETLVEKGVSIPRQAISRGLAQARWPGRFEQCPTEPRLWWDGAHNVGAAMNLRPLWNQSLEGRRPAAIVLALSRDKDVEGILRVLQRDFPSAAIVACRSRNERALPPAALVEHARGFGFACVESTDVASAIRQALHLAGDDPVLLTGSLFAIGEAMEVFGGAPGEQL
ncbi:MAG TPA: folylpolyglutamate synthase/dihydrofolate synthase family protein [Candidatus Limnocylindria bacterium]|nr:folylpolyglutamate synthase/dihydrofolate synthase family protein [Candidatus Limnocylindria bacterium]